MNQTLDLKSLLIGMLSAALIVTALSFKNQDSDRLERYKTTASGSGIMILDTETGDYIISANFFNEGWKKGNFSHVHRTSTSR